MPLQVFLYDYDYVFPFGLYLALRGHWDEDSPISRAKSLEIISLSQTMCPQMIVLNDLDSRSTLVIWMI